MTGQAAPVPVPGIRKWIVSGALCFILSAGIPIGYATWYTASYARHSCQALNLITAIPPAHPTRAQENFYHAVLLWAREDGC